MARYGVVDIANLFHRCLHVTSGDAFTKAGMSLSIIFQSLAKLRRDLKVDHMVICTEGRSWRFDHYPQYKGKRRADRLAKPLKEQEEDAVIFEVLKDLITYLSEKSRCTVLHSPRIEGDDFVARWIQLHPDDEHVILSGDSDFVQLLAPNVTIVDGAQQRILSLDGVRTYEGEPLTFEVSPKDGKIKVGRPIAEMRKAHEAEQKAAEKAHILAEKERAKAHAIMEGQRKETDPTHRIKAYVAAPFERVPYSFEPEAEWHRKALFVKCVRGDTGDSIFSAYPGVRYKGTKDRVGIEAAWDDRYIGGFAYNNFMLQSWEKLMGSDAQGNPIKKQVRVMDEFSFNASLIDLTQQPEDVKDEMDAAIIEAVQKTPVGNVGIHFLRFCDRQNLPRLAGDATTHAAYLNAPYSKG